jgi:lysophospholipase L1-like esterase
VSAVRHLKVILLNAGATLALLAVIEASSRLIRPVDLPDPLVTPGSDYWADRVVRDPILFWRMRAHLVENGESLTNSLGLRGPEITAKNPDEFRILSLGESTTFARHLSYEETYSSLLGEGLGRVDGKKVQVINAGAPGYSLFQGVTYLQHRALALEPDAVLIYFGYNDFLPIGRNVFDRRARGPAAVMTDRELFEKRKTRTVRLNLWLADRSNFFRLLLLRSISSAPPVDVDPTSPRVPEEDRRELLTDLRDWCVGHGLHLVVVIPWYRQFEGHIPLLRSFAASNDVPAVDLPARLGALPAPRASYFIDPVHPNARGHRLIAREIEEELRAKWAGREFVQGGG